MKRILMTCHFAGDRFIKLAEQFMAEGLDVGMITSSFSHKAKKQKEPDERPYVSFFHEPGYPTNVCPQRLASHTIAGKNLDKLLACMEGYDLVYSAVPSLSVAGVAAKWAHKWDIPFVIDVQDLWPEQFRMAISTQVVGDLLFQPLDHKANAIYGSADLIVAVSETYVLRAKEANMRAEGVCIYLGTELSKFDEYAVKHKDSDGDGIIRVAYIGTLGTSYDLGTVIKAISLAQSGMNCGLRLVVMGDGPYRRRFESEAETLGIDAEFTGTLPYAEMVARLTACDISVNPFIKTAPQSIVNKVCDYAAAGLPVVNTLGNSEYRNLLATYNAGITTAPEDPIELSQAIAILADDSRTRRKLGNGNRRLAQERFDRNRTYPALVERVKDLI